MSRGPPKCRTLAGIFALASRIRALLAPTHIFNSTSPYDTSKSRSRGKHNLPMATTTKALSSNWEILKKRLDADGPPKRKFAEPIVAPKGDKKLKRRRSDDAPSSSASGPKKTKTSAIATLKKKSTTTSTTVKPTTSARTAADKMGSDSSYSMKQPPSASLALWAEDNDIPAADLAKAYNLPLNSTNIPTGQAALEEPEEGGNRTELGKYIAMDCEMVGVGEGDRESSALARVSIVNFHGHCVLDLFVKPKEKVTDWRTWVSGVSPKDMEHAVTFEEAQKRAAEIMDGRILIGHAIKNDLECLLIGHPKRDIRDTSKHPDFKKYSKGRTPGLKKLAKEILGIEIQGGQHSSIEDARACMLLYRRFKEDFERENQIRFPLHAKKPGAGKKKKKNKK